MDTRNVQWVSKSAENVKNWILDAVQKVDGWPHIAGIVTDVAKAMTNAHELLLKTDCVQRVRSAALTCGEHLANNIAKDIAKQVKWVMEELKGAQRVGPSGFANLDRNRR